MGFVITVFGSVSHRGSDFTKLPNQICVHALKGLPAHVACVYTLAAAPVLFTHAAVTVADNKWFLRP